MILRMEAPNVSLQMRRCQVFLIEMEFATEGVKCQLNLPQKHTHKDFPVSVRATGAMRNA